MDVAALGLRVDGVGNIDQATASLGKFTGAASSAESATAKIDPASRKSSKSVQELATSGNSAARSMGSLSSAAMKAGGVLAAAFSVTKVIQYADAWSDMQSRVGAATGDMESAGGAMGRLLEIANASYSPLSQTAEIFSRNVSTFRDLGKSAGEAADFTESLNHMLVITATRGERAASVQNALSKAMAVGTLQADGLETVLANGGEVAQALARELGTTVSGLRAMSSQGKITGDVIANSITKSLVDVRDRAAEMPATMGDAFTRVGNNLTAFVGAMDQASGASGGLAAKIIELSDAALEFGTSEEFITGLLEWQGTLVALANDFGNLSRIISEFTSSAEDDADSISFAFGEIPANIRAIIQIATVEIASWIDAQMLGIQALAAAAKAITSGPSASVRAFNEVLSQNESLNQARLDSINAILEERDAILEGAAASAKSFKERTSQTLSYTATAVAATQTLSKEQQKASKAAANAAEQSAKQIQGEITALERAAKVWGMSADEVKIYDLAVKGASESQLEYAQSLLDTVSAMDQQKKAQEDYLSLVETLRTEDERKLDTLAKQLETMEKINGLSQGERRDLTGRMAGAAFESAPMPSGADGVDSGPLGELSKLADAERAMDDWYAAQMERLALFRQERSDMNAEWDEQELVLKQQHEDAMANIERARWQAGLNATQGFLTQLQGLRDTDSKKGRQVAKTAAIAQATINAYTAATGAYASASAIPVVGWVMGPIAAAAALAAGLANVSAIRGQAHDGIMSVPSSGTWNLEKGERVTTANTSAALDATLARIQYGLDTQGAVPTYESVRAGRQSSSPAQAGTPASVGTRGNVTVNQTNNFGAPDNRTANQIAASTARKGRVASARGITG